MAVSIPEDLVAEWKLLRQKPFINNPDPFLQEIQQIQMAALRSGSKGGHVIRNADGTICLRMED